MSQPRRSIGADDTMVSLDALAADPTLTASLSFDQARTLLARLVPLQAVLIAAALAQALPPPPLPAERAVRLDEAVTLLACSKDYLYRHWQRLGGYRDDDSHIKFSLSTIRRHIERRVITKKIPR